MNYEPSTIAWENTISVLSEDADAEFYEQFSYHEFIMIANEIVRADEREIAEAYFEKQWSQIENVPKAIKVDLLHNTGLIFEECLLCIDEGILFISLPFKYHETLTRQFSLTEFTHFRAAR